MARSKGNILALVFFLRDRNGNEDHLTPTMVVRKKRKKVLIMLTERAKWNRCFVESVVSHVQLSPWFPLKKTYGYDASSFAEDGSRMSIWI